MKCKSELYWLRIILNWIFYDKICLTGLYGLVYDMTVLYLKQIFCILQVDFDFQFFPSWVSVRRHFKNPTISTLYSLILNRKIFDFKIGCACSLKVFKLFKADFLPDRVLTSVKRVVTLNNKRIRLLFVFYKGWKIFEFNPPGVNRNWSEYRRQLFCVFGVYWIENQYG